MSEIFFFFSLGTVFLWIFWPSFNGGFADDQQQRDRAYLNTFLSLCASTAITFAVSALVDKKGRFDMVSYAVIYGQVSQHGFCDGSARFYQRS